MTNYEDPRWQKIRLQIFERDKWQCVGCCDSTSTLVVHHKKYVGEIWESPAEDLQTLCKNCHDDFGKHPKSGVYWGFENSTRVLHVTHCPLCACADFYSRGDSFRCANCGWSSDSVSSVSLCHGEIHQQNKTPTLFGQEIRRVYLAGKMADPWRDELITNCENGWSSANHGIHALIGGEDDGSWSVLRGVVNVPDCRPIDFCGPYWDTSLDPWGGHGHASLVDRDSPYMHASGEHGDWAARYLTMARCRRAINRCDLFFAWIDSMDAFGTLVEIGMAVRSKCRIVIGLGANTNEDLWFAASLADGCVWAACVIDAWKKMWAEYAREPPAIRGTQELLAAAVRGCELKKETAHG